MADLPKSAAVVLRVLAIAGAIVALEHFVVRPWRASEELNAVDSRTGDAEEASGFQRILLARENLRTLDAIAASSRRSVDYFLIRGANEKFAGDLPASIASYTAALSVDRRPEIYYRRGLVFAENGQRDAAIADLLRAASFSHDRLTRWPRSVPRHIRDQLRAVGIDPAQIR